MVLKILTVAGLATFEIYAAIPAGFIFGLSPWTIFVATVAGGLTGAFIVTFFGDKIRAFLHKKRPAKEEAMRHPVLARIWKKYGTGGLGFFGTITVGAPISIALGTGLNVNLKKLLIWCCMGVVLRCALFTILGFYGVQLVEG